MASDDGGSGDGEMYQDALTRAKQVCYFLFLQSLMMFQIIYLLQSYFVM